MRARQDVKKAREEEREGVSGLVDDEIDAVDESQGPARRIEVEAAREDLPGQDDHHEQSRGAT